MVQEARLWLRGRGEIAGQQPLSIANFTPVGKVPHGD
jgi:hypothetical protein